MIVMKFGGSAVQDANAMRKVVALVKRESAREAVVVVISALSKVTNQLTEVAGLVSDGARVVAYHLLDEITLRHNTMTACLGLQTSSLEFEELKSVEPEGNFPRFMDRVMAAGELVSSRILAEALFQAGVHAQWIDARRVVVTDDKHTEAAPECDATLERARAMILPSIERSVVPVIGGFIGATREGVTTTLGREGSDLTATLLGACLGASEVQKWTDVPGIMTANPRHDPTAHTRARMTFAEADQFARTGGMLHPRTIKPLLAARIPLVVRNINTPDNPGTRISDWE